MNSLPKTVTRQRRGCDLNPGPSAPESSTLTTRLPSQRPGNVHVAEANNEKNAPIPKQTEDYTKSIIMSLYNDYIIAVMIHNVHAAHCTSNFSHVTMSEPE